MVKYSKFLLVGLCSVALLSCATKVPQIKDGKKLVWSDEFSKDGMPDQSKWEYAVGGDGFGNNELQFYTKERKENARIENGMLVIEARKEKWENNE